MLLRPAGLHDISFLTECFLQSMQCAITALVGNGNASGKPNCLDGKELFYLGPDGSLMAVPIDSTGPFHGGVPRTLFPLRLASLAVSSNNTGQVYAATKDGQRFLVNAALPSSAAPLTVLLNWTSAIQK